MVFYCTSVTQLPAASHDLDWTCPKGWIFETISYSFTPWTLGYSVSSFNRDAPSSSLLIVSKVFCTQNELKLSGCFIGPRQLPVTRNVVLTFMYARQWGIPPWFTIVDRGFAGAVDILKGALQDRRRQPVTGSIKSFRSAPARGPPSRPGLRKYCERITLIHRTSLD